MAGTDRKKSEDQERQQDRLADPNRRRTIQGECHDPVTGVVYAVSIVVASTDSDDPPALENGVSWVLESPGLVGGLSLRSTGSDGAWDGHHRV